MVNDINIYENFIEGLEKLLQYSPINKYLLNACLQYLFMFHQKRALTEVWKLLFISLKMLFVIKILKLFVMFLFLVRRFKILEGS